MRNILFVFILCISFADIVSAQTMHSIIFANMEEQGREVDRTAEMRNMTEFCNMVASSLGYSHDLRRHSGREFTSVMLEREIASLNVNDDDIVLFYYDGHGCNWDDDDWPHMALLDKQYWATTAYNKLKAVSKRAKLLLCIASCCNMDSEGQRRASNNYALSTIDRDKVRKLFTGFRGRRSIITSASIRGQYSWSWTGGITPGSQYTISLRKVIKDAVSGASNTELTWESILKATEKQTLAYSKGKQLPQFKIEENTGATTSVRTTVTSKPTPATASVEKVWVEHNKVLNGVPCMEIHVRFKTHHMNEQGGRLVAFFDSPKGVGLRDTNGRYRTVNGNVCVGSDFGSHYEHSLFEDLKLVMPNSEIHPKQGTKTYYIRVFVYDFKQGKYIANSDFISFDMQ